MNKKTNFSNSQAVILFVALIIIGLIYIVKYERKTTNFLIKTSNYVQRVF